jgi:hypothetical protein
LWFIWAVAWFIMEPFEPQTACLPGGAVEGCMRDVKEVHTTVCRQLFLSVCEKWGGELDVRERIEFPPYQTCSSVCAVEIDAP